MKYLWDEVKRFENPHEYVDLTQNLWEIKQKMLPRAQAYKAHRYFKGGIHMNIDLQSRFDCFGKGLL